MKRSFKGVSGEETLKACFKASDNGKGEQSKSYYIGYHGGVRTSSGCRAGSAVLRIFIIVFLFLFFVGAANAVTEIDSCTTISTSGSYRLTQNIIGSGVSTCIDITASDVIFDGASHTISGEKTDYTSGILVRNTDVTVKNVMVTRWGRGIGYANVKGGLITGNTVFNNNWGGIALDSSSNIAITGNDAYSNGGDGIFLNYSYNNDITDNTVSSNNDYGIYLDSSSSNLIYNNYFNNANNAHDDGTNDWNTAKTPDTNIIGGPYLGGNFWSDYAGSDADGDGLGDTSYYITGGSNKDNLPLVEEGSTTTTTSTTTTSSTTSTSSTTTTIRRSPGGGGGTPTSFETYIKNVLAGETIELDIDDEDIPYINGLSLTAKQDIYSSKLSITDIDKKPWYSMAEPDAKVFRYFKVSYDKNNYVESAKLRFSIKKSWLEENNIDPYKFFMYRYTNTWEELDSEILNEDDEKIYFEAATLGFSYLSIGGVEDSGYTLTVNPPEEEVEPEVSIPVGPEEDRVVPKTAPPTTEPPITTPSSPDTLSDGSSQKNEYWIFNIEIFNRNKFSNITVVGIKVRDIFPTRPIIIIIIVLFLIVVGYFKRRVFVEKIRLAKAKPCQAGDVKSSAPIYSLPEELHKYYEDPVYYSEGGTSNVYKARRKKDGLTVAIKVTKYWDRHRSKSFVDEVSIWKGLNHPNIAKIYNYAAHPRGYIEMEFVENSLEKLPKPIDPQKAAYLIFKIAEGLKYAHGRAKPVYHIDLKPGNVLLANDEEPKIVDWGLAKVVSFSKYSNGRARDYTTLYAAPEQILNKKVDARTDIFQVGQIFYELVTGKAPFEADSESAIMEKIKNEQPIWPSDINPEAKRVDSIIMRCLKKEKEKRYQSVEELQRELADVLGIKPEQQVKITGHRKDRIIAYTELIEKCSHRDEKNECILWLNSLKAVVKAAKVKALIEEEIGRIELHIKEDVKIEERMPAIDEIIHKARMEG